MFQVNIVFVSNEAFVNVSPSLVLDPVYTDNKQDIKPPLLMISSQAKTPSGLSSHLNLMPTLNAVESST